MDAPSTDSRDAHLFGPGPKRILALDGGGVRGIISLAFLERVEALLRERSGNPAVRLADYFDLIGGTSTGSIIAAGLALGLPVARLIDIYVNLAREGFQRRGWFGGLLVPKFRAAALERAIRAQVGDATLGSGALLTGFAAIAKRLDTASVWVFHNHPHGKFFGPSEASQASVPNRDLLLAQIIRASTAAPSYFEPELIEVAPGTRGAFIDGGISPHNNPALLLLMLATINGYGFRWPTGSERLLLMSIGTGGGAAPPHPADELVHKPALLLAVGSLQSLMLDCHWLGQALLQWMGQSPTLWPIDAEVGDLGADRLGPEKLFHYVRYDAPLDAAWLAARAELIVSETELVGLRAFDRPEAVGRLLEIARCAANRTVRPEHIPDKFDIAGSN